MEKAEAIQLMSALAQPTRLHVFSILAQHQPAGLPVGELAALAETPQNTMSSHLAILARAGAVTSSRHGRSIRYSVRPEAVRDLAVFLLKDCGAS